MKTNNRLDGSVRCHGDSPSDQLYQQQPISGNICHGNRQIRLASDQDSDRSFGSSGSIGHCTDNACSVDRLQQFWIGNDGETNPSNPSIIRSADHLVIIFLARGQALIGPFTGDFSPFTSKLLLLFSNGSELPYVNQKI